MIYDSILDTIGDTPIIRLNRIAPDGLEMFVKVESFNPLASVKDRLAFAIVTDASGLNDSTLTNISMPSGAIRLRRIMGVLPIVSRILS